MAVPDIACSLDAKYAKEIAALLQPPSSKKTKEYYEKLMSERKIKGLKVKECPYAGKGLYADQDFNEGDLILRDDILVGSQHPWNKAVAYVCSHCFCYMGSVESQIGRHLDYLNCFKDDRQNRRCPGDTAEHTENDKRQARSSSVNKKKQSGVSPETLEGLIYGSIELPYSAMFGGSPPRHCLECSLEVYCSIVCELADKGSSHSVLCFEKGSRNREAYDKFINHAVDTNDIFILAAKVIAFTIAKYHLLHKDSGAQGQANSSDKMDPSMFSLLLEAWEPFSMVYKKRWWDCVALPEDVPPSQESLFRSQLKALAYESLQLLKEAIFIEDCAPLFSLETYGYIIGMFELNNLDLVVASPVEDYFLFIDDLPPAEKAEVEKLTKPLLDALDDSYSACCEGSALYPIHSCMNHSCSPNSKAFKRDEDRDGRATIIASRSIRSGEEITISYIDEEASYEERQAALADYGFQCKCPKCTEEAA